MDFLSGLIDFIVGIFVGDWEQAWAGIREMFSSIWNSMKLILSTIWNNMKDGVKAAISAIKGHISDSLHNIKGGWRESWTSMKTTVLGIFDAIKSGIKGKINSIISFVENMANSIIIGVNKVLEALNSAEHFTQIYRHCRQYTFPVWPTAASQPAAPLPISEKPDVRRCFRWKITCPIWSRLQK